MSYMVWFDDDKKKPAGEKIGEAVARYQEIKGEDPVECLCHPSHQPVAAPLGVLVRFENFIQPHDFYIGQPDPPAEVRLT